MSTVDKKEVEKFSKLASDWWNPNGKFRPLHLFNPTRIKFIKEKLIYYFRLDSKSQEQLKKINILERLPAILEKIPSINKIVVVPYPGTEVEKNKNTKIKTYAWDELISYKNKNKIQFVLSNFNDPLVILYSSGTTGKPKCICHGTGGVLLQHNKELQIHSDFFSLNSGKPLFHQFQEG